jgi:hypothetical protein
MVKKDSSAGNNHKTLKIFLFGFLCLVVLYIFLGSFKVLYVNLHNAYKIPGTYNPNGDLVIAALSSILIGFVLGYWLKSKR